VTGPATGVAVVTGASTGIGAATATALARAGLHVLAGVRDDASAERTARAAAAEDLRVEPVHLDVTAAADVAALRGRVEELARQGLPLAALVNNAGLAVTGPVECVPLDAWREQLEVNLLGAVATTQALLPALVAARGAVVNVSSMAGRVVGPLFAPYSASKHALEATSDALRREVRRLGVRVVVVEPGVVRTGIWAKGLATQAVRDSWLDDAQRSRYGAFLAAAERAARGADRRGVEAQAVADVVVRAVRSRRPRTRYPVGRDAALAVRLARLLPDRALDALVAGLRG